MYIQARNRFKQLCKLKKLAYQRKNRINLIENINDPETFWKLIKQNSRINAAVNKPIRDIQVTVWRHYFKEF